MKDRLETLPENVKISKELHTILPYSFVKEHRILPIEKKEGKVTVALIEPYSLQQLEKLRFYFGSPIIPYTCSETRLKELIQQCYVQEEAQATQLPESLELQSGLKDEISNYDLLEGEEQAPIIRFINSIISEAIKQRASDIHIDPLENHIVIRYRIDGVLYCRHTVPKEYQSQVLSRIKVMARLDVAEKRLPQDGSIQLNLGNREIDFRISTLPATNGERIVLRILDKAKALLALESLGMPSDIYQAVNKFARYPEGIILVTGPTGSGKTTTLYSIIKKIQDPSVNIMSIEDPVEYHLPGIAQISVQPAIELTFARGLKHILRQDPDVILVGEVRDRETAEIAIQASLTGHLVFTTLHTNDAPSSLTRLVEMGIEPYLLTSSVIATCAQRLVRKLCSHCKLPYLPTKEELNILGIPFQKELTFFSPKGCEKCFHSGYYGRQGLYELSVMDDAVKKQVLKLADAPSLRRETLKQGFPTLKKHGATLVQQGVTHTKEVLKVCRF